VKTEWPTVGIAVGVWGGWAAMLVFHDRLPWPLVVLGFALLNGWYMSLQHEVLHGHFTRWWWLNDIVGGVPTNLWLPYDVYRETHLDHHRVELTVPGVDPESFYVTPAQWAGANRLRRAVWRANRTFVGRMLLGPAIGPPMLVASRLRRAMRDRREARVWALHAVQAAVVGYVVFGVAGVPVWQYLLGYVYFGMSVTYIRSFVEHLATPSPDQRTAVVRSNWFFGLLFLNNNLHVTHHALPSAPWYRYRELGESLGSEQIAAEGAGLYRGYLEVIRRFGVRPFDQPITPLVDQVSRG
jgi:fatty acid desaturase